MESARVHLKFQRAMWLAVMMFKWGIICADTSGSCSSSPCQNGSTCLEMEEDYTCICSSETVLYMGKDCEAVYDPCAFAGCPNCTSTPGTEDFTCICPHGYTGTNCTLRAGPCESDPCSGVMTECVEDGDGHVCVCPRGYSGDECQTPSEDCSKDPCLNNGTCVGLPDGVRCECAPGFRGERCEEDIDECRSQPCQNGAICMDNVDAYHCFCVPGFQGYNCEIDINECASRPCENNGTCVNGKDRYSCECLLGYKGVNCEMEIDECESNPCKNGATCHDHVGLYTCECPLGYEGLNCEIDIDECASAPCQNEGTCKDLVNSYECDCSDTGFMGDTCEVDIPECDSNPCQNNGSCQEWIKAYTCLCWPGYGGENCEMDIDECAEEPCENGGACFERSDITHYGSLPQLAGEFSYADAAGYLCECLPGFTGENCSINIDECESAPCANGGKCEDLVNAYQCVCLPGFTGTHCEVEVNECESQPCQNGAYCKDGIAEYTCDCPVPEPGEEPWGGHDCDVRLVGCHDHSCQNGATCLPYFEEDQHGYICLCPSGLYDEHCSTPTTFSFSAPGLAIIEINLNIRIFSLRFRTTLPNAILLFSGDASSHLSLELVRGRLRAKASSGGAVLLAEAMGVVSNGDWHDVNVTLDKTLALVVTGQGCRDVGCQVEDRGGEGQHFDPQHSFSRVMVGGVPPELLDYTESRSGFLGCMEDLEVESNIILPQDIPPDQAQSLELGCNKTEWCEPDPCSSRGLCVDLWTSFRCDCHRPFHGANCTEEYPSWTFGHEDTKSYVSYALTADQEMDFSVSFFLRSLKEDGLIFQLRRKGEAFFTVYLQMGLMTISIPSTPPTSAPIFVTNGERILLTVEVQYGHAILKWAEEHHQLAYVGEVTVKQGDLVFVGGLPEDADTEPWGGHFKGCLQDLRLGRVRLEMSGLGDTPTDSSYSTNMVHKVKPNCISDNTCQVAPCQNGGKCTVTWNDFECDCPLNHTGKMCEKRVWCVSDPCVYGSHCVDLPDGYECLTNATFQDNGLQFSANNSLVAPVTSVSVELRTREENGVLLRASLGMELFCVGLLNSSVLVKIRSGNSTEVLAFTSRQPVSDGDWHRLEVAMTEPHRGAARWAVTVDGQNGGTSLGTTSNLNFLNESVVWLAENFTGCLGEVRVGGVHLPLVHEGEFPQQSRFLRHGGEDVQVGCTGSPVCLSQPCLNNGTCEDLFNLFTCSCAAGWEGQYCADNTNDCASSPCVHGTCGDRLADFHCDCLPGYGGKVCSDDLDECLGHGCENGGTCVDGVASYTCVCPPNFTGPFCQWSFPPLQCDQDLQCVNEGVCSDGIWGANCTCVPGYTGVRCEVEVDECESNPCHNGGSCVDRLNRFQCVCMPGFMGAQCENSKQAHKERVPLLVVAIPLACCCVLLAVIGLTFMVMTARKKRQSEGTYSPSQQEVAGARLEMDSVLKVPPEERLI